jgi:hypothetical protein
MTEPKPTYKTLTGMTEPEAAFTYYWRTLAPDAPEPKHEYRFHPERRWQFDFAWPGAMAAVEVEGGIWSKGRHVRGNGYEDDCKKYNAAALLGWRVFRCTPGMLSENAAGFIEMVKAVVDGA